MFKDTLQVMLEVEMTAQLRYDKLNDISNIEQKIIRIYARGNSNKYMNK